MYKTISLTSRVLWLLVILNKVLYKLTGFLQMEGKRLYLSTGLYKQLFHPTEGLIMVLYLMDTS